METNNAIRTASGFDRFGMSDRTDTDIITETELTPAEEKKRFKKAQSRIGWGMNIYMMIMLVVSVIGIVAVGIIEGIYTAITGNSPGFVDNINQNGWILTIAVAMAGLVLTVFMKDRVKVKEIFIKRGTMTASKFFLILPVFMGVQFLATIFSGLAESLLNGAGLTMSSAIDSASSGSTTLSMFLYAGIVAPVSEEIIFRGFGMLGSLKNKDSKLLAIIVSSLFFGFMHANLVQIPFACVVGIVLAYVTLEYGVIWSMLLHLLNNMVFGDFLTYFEKMFSESTGNAIEMVFQGAMFIAGIAVIILKRKQIGEYIRNNKCSKKYIIWAVTSIPFIIFALLNTIMAVYSIKPMA